MRTPCGKRIEKSKRIIMIYELYTAFTVLQLPYRKKIRQLLFFGAHLAIVY